MTLPSKPMPFSGRPRPISKPPSLSQRRPLGPKPDLGGAKPKNGSPFSQFFGDSERKSVFDLRKSYKKTYNKDRGRYGTRSEKFSDIDQKNLEDFITANPKYSADGVISKSELKRILDFEIDPALNKMRDPKTGKWLNPYVHEDKLRMQDLKEMKGYIKDMINRKK